MNKKRLYSALLALTLVLSIVSVTLVSVSAGAAATPPTGYTSAEDVVYTTVTVDGKTVIVNWGARDEDCLFLSPNAAAFYTDNNTYETLSALAGGSGTADAAQSPLYDALQQLMVSRHTYINNYQETRPWYAYTDCVSGKTDQLSSFYSGQLHSSKWDSGNTWNREHTWPNSKGMEGDDENDIMMLRPTIKTENGSRGNKAFGESAGYFDPGPDARGDCARIVLYVYTRWGNTSRMWGQDGVMESMEILLKWMAEDPVDTWEMGRNDAVESLTGTRNVFVDYPEYAWLLFGQEVPATAVTPSGKASDAPAVPVEPAETWKVDFELPGWAVLSGEDAQEVTVERGQAVTLPEPTMEAGTEEMAVAFYGWSLSKLDETTALPADAVLSGRDYTPTEDTTLYAVFFYARDGKNYYGHLPQLTVECSDGGCASTLTVAVLPLALLTGLGVALARRRED